MSVNNRVPRVKISCPVCGTEISMPRSGYKQRLLRKDMTKVITCSRECANVLKRRRKRIRTVK
ncbi:MAG: hypothetical protein MUO73_03215 [Thermoplasmata archaeon]|nr:hypothetical protein [Thermoplasmata archaeon]